MLKIIGLGSELRGDDRIGPEIIKSLRKMELDLPVKLYNVGSDAFSIIEHLIGEEPVLIVDCAKMGKKPGSVQKLNIDEVNLHVVDRSLSLHGMSFAEAYRLAKSMGKVAPCSLIAIEPEQVNFNVPLSDIVRKKIPEIIKMVLEEAKANAEQKNLNH
ncbi:MAG: hydrogenase maturation protease [Calditrichaceae bacterium]|nr:hydrogenase maturation protease [Calditrichaceae bacterium]MBN2709622.1 hydrogenase maturation protease [Calditrichaceae bacterium]